MRKDSDQRNKIHANYSVVIYSFVVTKSFLVSCGLEMTAKTPFQVFSRSERRVLTPNIKRCLTLDIYTEVEKKHRKANVAERRGEGDSKAQIENVEQIVVNSRAVPSFSLH